MKVISAYLIFLVGYTSSFPGASFRNYRPEEEFANHTRYIYLEGPEGSLKTIDLTEETVTYTAKETDVTYYFFSRKNPSNGILVHNIDEIANAKFFDKSKQTLFICHGWNNDHSSPVNTLITAAVLKNYDINVFVVDWSGPANKNYLSAKSAVVEIGYFVGNFINGLMKKYSMNVSKFVLTGHSLGAHVVGATGASLNGVIDHIIGLDPAGPLFTLSNTYERLDTTDALYVQIIHTCAGELGFGSSIGHADFYPNGGGSSQPGCGVDLAGTCSHGRSYRYFAESLNLRGALFQSEKCTSYKSYLDWDCVNNQLADMGQLNPRKVFGDFYLKTNADPPYAQG